VASLTDAQAEFLLGARRAVLATIRPNGRPRLVPCVFAASLADGVVLYTALDEKPKSVSDPFELGRVRDIRARPQVSLLVDRWSEDWSELSWLRLDGQASVLEPGLAEHGLAVRLLRERYPQYESQRIESRPVIRIEVEAATDWGARP
jgi:PPOX class probable F420-dependent enzyme